MLSGTQISKSLQLTSLGVCAQLNNVTERVLNASSTKAMQALSEVSDAFQRALQNDTPAVPIMKKTAAYIIDKFKEDLSAKGWSGREGLYKRIVNTSIDALKNHTR